MDFTPWLELGATFTIGGFAIWILYKMNMSKDTIIKNHLDHATEAQKDESKSKVKLAKSIQKLSDTIDKKIK